MLLVSPFHTNLGKVAKSIVADCLSMVTAYPGFGVGIAILFKWTKGALRASKFDEGAVNLAVPNDRCIGVGWPQ